MVYNVTIHCSVDITATYRTMISVLLQLPCSYVITLFYRGSTSDEATQNIINVQIPSIANLCSTGELHVDNIDVFCEKGVFDTDQTWEILLTGKQAGWNINFHGDELHSMNSGEVNIQY